MKEWLSSNISWIFSGVGVLLLSFIGVGIAYMWNKHRRHCGILKIVNVTFTRNGEFDVKLLNVGDTAAVLTRIAIVCVKDMKVHAKSMLRPSATYSIPVDGMNQGEMRDINISHTVDAGSADRILIALGSTHVYTLKVSIHYNESECVSFTRTSWFDK